MRKAKRFNDPSRKAKMVVADFLAVSLEVVAACCRFWCWWGAHHHTQHS
jgi:hypothetical protein